MRRILAVLSFILLLWAAPALARAEGPMTKAALLPLWAPQAQFAGYYVALDKGIYRKYGIDLAIIPGGPGRTGDEYLRSGKADFAVLWLTTAIQRRAGGLKLVNIAQIIRKSALMLVAKKSSGIKGPEDLRGKKVGLWEGDLSIPPRAFFRKYNLGVKTVTQTYSVNLFLRGGVDAASAMSYNEYHTILNSGLDPDELTTFSFQDYGLNFPEDGLYTLEKTCLKNPGLARAFVNASLEGWQYAFSHPDEALDIVIKYMRQAKVPANRTHQKWMLNKMKDLIAPSGAALPMGALDPSDYKMVARELEKARLVKKAPGFSEFYKECAGRVQK